MHRLVIEAFQGSIPKGLAVNHKDGNKKNNVLVNLEVVTYSQNIRHAIETGLKPIVYGEDVPTSKIDNKTARLLIGDIIEGFDNDYLSEKYSLHSRYISLVRHKRRWKKLWEEFPDYISEKSNGNDRVKKLSPEEFLEIVDKLKMGYTNAKITREYNLASGTASRIRHRKSYKEYWARYIDNIDKNKSKGEYMTKTDFEKVREFQKAFNCPAPEEPTPLDDKLAMNRASFIMEEVIELLYATAGTKERFDQMFDELISNAKNTYSKQLTKPFPDDKLIGQIDALTDILYFTNGGFVETSVIPDKIVDIVHQANMNKIFSDGKPHYNEVGKVIKPEGWVAPEPLIEEEINRQIELGAKRFN